MPIQRHSIDHSTVQSTKISPSETDCSAILEDKGREIMKEPEQVQQKARGNRSTAITATRWIVVIMSIFILLAFGRHSWGN
jgi:hypothetical protein